jgi:hypothetical protein
MMDRKVSCAALVVMLFAICFPADAHQGKTVRRIGFLVNTGTPYHDAFYQRLRELGYIEGQNLIVETRYAESKNGCQLWLRNWSDSELK